jgi:RasGEF domain
MSFPRGETNLSPESVQEKAFELNALCRAAYLNYANQLVPADISKKETIKSAKEASDTANDEIDLLIKNKITAVDSALKTNFKMLKDTKDELRIIIDKKLSNHPITNREAEQLSKYQIDKSTLDKIAVEKKKVDEAADVLFKLAVNPPSPSKESAVARQTLLSFVSYDILVAETDVEKAKTIEHWTQVLNTMLEGGNYYGAYVLVNALNDSKINELNAMQLVSTEAQEVLAKATEIFSSAKNMNAHMEAAAKSGKFVIPSTHLVEGSLIGCSQKTDYVGWNKIISSLDGYTQALKSKPAPMLNGPFVSGLLQGKISETVSLTQEKESKTDVSMVSIVESRRKSTLKAEAFNDLLSVKSSIASNVEAMRSYIDSRAEHTQARVIKRSEILRDLVDAVKRTTGTFASLLDREKQQELLNKIDTALKDDAISKPSKTRKGPTQTHDLIDGLRELVAQLNRKTSFVEVRSEEVKEIAAPKKPLPNIPQYNKSIAPEPEGKPIYIGPRYVPPLSKMQAIFNRIVDPVLVKNAEQLQSAMKVLMEQKTLRKHDNLFDPVMQSSDALTDQMRSQQDKLELRQDRLAEEIKSAKIVHDAIKSLQDNRYLPNEVSKLISGFNHHLQKMSMDALDHPNPDLLSDIKKLKLVRPEKTKAEVEVTAPVSADTIEQNDITIGVLELQRQAVIARHLARESTAARNAKGKEEMPPLNAADRQRVDGLNADINTLHEANSAMYNRIRNNMVSPIVSQSAAMEPQPVVATAEKSTIMRMLDRVKGLFTAKPKALVESAKLQSTENSNQSYIDMARTIGPKGGGKGLLTDHHAGMQEVKTPDNVSTTPAVKMAESSVAVPVQPEGTTRKMSK